MPAAHHGLMLTDIVVAKRIGKVLLLVGGIFKFRHGLASSVGVGRRGIVIVLGRISSDIEKLGRIKVVRVLLKVSSLVCWREGEWKVL